jgi:hypothetical protein
MRLTCRCGKMAEENSTECFNCRLRSVTFTFRGGGGYTRADFHDRTISERRNEILGDRVLGVDCEPASTYGW